MPNSFSNPRVAATAVLSIALIGVIGVFATRQAPTAQLALESTGGGLLKADKSSRSLLASAARTQGASGDGLPAAADRADEIVDYTFVFVREPQKPTHESLAQLDATVP